FTATVQTHWTADSSGKPAGARGDWYPVSGSWKQLYTDLWVPAGGAISPAELFAFMPFDPSSRMPPDQVNLKDITGEQFSLSRRYARPLAQGRLEQLESEAVAAHVPGQARNIHVNVLMEDSTSIPALAPVYVMAYRYRDQVHRYLINGQTGRATGTAPVSMAK